MTCAVYLRDLIVFTLIFHIVDVNHYKSVKSIDNNLYKKIMDAKSKQSYPLYIWRYTTLNTKSKTDWILLLLKQWKDLL